MTFKLYDLQETAEKGLESFNGRTCLHATLHCVNTAMKNLDGIDYVNPLLIKASIGLPAGIWAGTSACGVVVAGAMAISLKYGTEDTTDFDKIWETGMRARNWYLWFLKQFGSCNCIDLTHGTDFSDRDQIKDYMEGPRRHLCQVYKKQGVRKLIEYLTIEDEKVIK